jgi:flagellar basal-body rod modification protein FlgD
MPTSVTFDQINAGTSVPVNQQTPSRNTLGKDDFLRLLVTRLANQDPSSPMQDEQFVAQMAQFTQLEQLQNMNSNLEKALGADMLLSQTINNTMATSLIGRSVRVQSDSVVLDQSGVADIAFALEKAARDVTIEIFNADGTMIRAMRMENASSGAGQITWDGLDAQGIQAAPGQYSMKIVAEDAEGKPVVAHGYLNGKVDGVRYVDGAALLTVGNVLIPLSEVLEVRTSDG